MIKETENPYMTILKGHKMVPAGDRQVCRPGGEWPYAGGRQVRRPGPKWPDTGGRQVRRPGPKWPDAGGRQVHRQSGTSTCSRRKLSELTNLLTFNHEY